MGCSAAISALGAALTLAAGGDRHLDIGTGPSFPPYVVIDEAGAIDGSDFEMMQDICRRIRHTCHWQTVPFRDLIPGVQSGQFDAALGGMAISPERRRIVDFSQPYATGGGLDWFVGPAGAPLPDRATTAVVSGTIQEIFARNEGLNHIAFPSEPEALAATAGGMTDLALGPFDDRPDLQPLIGGAGLEFLYSAEVPDEGVGIVVCKGNLALLTLLNGAIDEMFADGTMEAINSRWP